MKTLQEISDRLEIQDLITSYCYAIDNQDFDALDDVFTEDAHIDYTATGGSKGSLPEIKVYLAQALKIFPGMQHFASNTILKLEKDTASGETMLFNPMVAERDGEQVVFFIGARYIDRFERTEKGWRISNRAESLSYTHNIPEWFAPAS
ncbi:MAG: nuclear transport factor 2 family protein [Pseudomonadota bacterium]